MEPYRFKPLSPVYNRLHKLLQDTLLCLRVTESDLSEHGVLANRLAACLAVFENQTAWEETVLFSAIHDYEPFLTAILRDDHRDRMRHVRRLQDMISSHDSDTKNISHGSLLVHRFTAFMNCCLTQMKDHEAMINPVLWRYYSDEELTLIMGERIAAERTQTGIPVCSGSYRTAC